MKHWPMMLMVLVACDESSGSTKEVELRFAAQVGDEAFACTKTFTAGTSNVTLEPEDFRFYVHDVRLVDAAGVEHALTLTDDDLWQTSDVVLLDFEDKSGTCSNGTTPMNTVIRGTIDGDVDAVGVRFKVGVPFTLNHADGAAAASPLNLSGLYWGWQAGYKFMRFDMKAGAQGVSLHLGSTGCVVGEGTTDVSSCSAGNRPEIALSDFDPASDTIVIDYAALVAGLDLTTDGGGMPGCMSSQDDPECAVVFEHLGLDLATGEPKAGQTAFRVD